MGKDPAILMKMPGKLRVGADGNWLHDGELITHDGVAAYFAKHLCYDKDHDCYTVNVGGKAVVVEVEDAPLVIRSIDMEQNPWILDVGYGQTAELNPQTLSVLRSGVFYCNLPGGLSARFGRNATQSLMKHIGENTNGIFININGSDYPLTSL